MLLTLVILAVGTRLSGVIDSLRDYCPGILSRKEVIGCYGFRRSMNSGQSCTTLARFSEDSFRFPVELRRDLPWPRATRARTSRLMALNPTSTLDRCIRSIASGSQKSGVCEPNSLMTALIRKNDRQTMPHSRRTTNIAVCDNMAWSTLGLPSRGRGEGAQPDLLQVDGVTMGPTTCRGANRSRSIDAKDVYRPTRACERLRAIRGGFDDRVGCSSTLD
jgi:hypothetical protein